MPRPPFRLETLVDFPDDALSHDVTVTPRHLDALMALLARHGVSRVVWAYYGDGHGGWLMPSGVERLAKDLGISLDQNLWSACARTYEALGNPLAAAVEAAHRHGIEVYAYFKPYETGPALDFAEGSPEAREWGRLPRIGGYLSWLDPFVLRHPHLRLKRRADDLWPGHETATIDAIRLTKKDDAPTRVTKERLQIWTSDLNFRYRRRDIGFTFSETVEPSPREVRDVYGNVLTRRGEPVRVLTLGGLALNDRYVVVATDFADAPGGGAGGGAGGAGDFTNAWDRLLTAYDAHGREIPGVYATGTAIWFPEFEDFRERGLQFDTGRGPEAVTLDAPSRAEGGSASDQWSLPGQKKVSGAIGFARGRNAYLPGGLCETEPLVQDYWLSCIEEMLDAGVDGVELRVENHSCHTDTPQDYGFNPAVMRRVDPKAADLVAEVTRVRTDAYTRFLRRAKALVAARGRRMRVNLNVDWFRPPHERPGSRKLAYPANIDFEWRRWLDEGLLDEATLRVFAKPFEGIFGQDAVAQEMVAACGARGVPVTVNRYVWSNEKLAEEFRRVRDDGRFAGLILYETWSYTELTDDGWVLAREPMAGESTPVPASVAKTRAKTATHVREVWEACGSAQ